MTNNEAAKWIQLYIDLAKIDPTTGEDAYLNEDDRKTLEAMGMARDALTCNRLATNLQPCKQDDLIRRSDALGCYHDWVDRYGDVHTPDEMAEYRAIEALPPVESEITRCKDCKHFELDHFEKVKEFPVPIIVAHEICMKWGDGCRTSVDGWCFMAERRTDE